MGDAEIANKKARTDEINCEEKEPASNSVQLSDFTLDNQLTNCQFSKKIYLQGSLKNKPGKAIVLLEKTAFAPDDFPGAFENSQPPKIYFENDIYLSFCHYAKPQFSGFKTTLIYPATEDLIKKYTLEPNRICEETGAQHAEVTAPYITEKHPPPEWLYNILDHKSEADRIIYEDPDKESGFILLPDLKWDGKNPEAFYVQALPHIRGLRTIRDLTAQHLPLLRKIASIAPKVIEEKYNISRGQLLVYFHYLPSFYHIHVHFKLIGVEGTTGTGCERAHLLSTVISNLTISPDYYQKATLPISLRKSDPLLAKLISSQGAA